jgi:hypothetical protein
MLSNTMAPWSERIKAKLGRKKPLTSPPSKASSTSTIPHVSTVVDPTASSPSLPERLWNQAYDQARAGDSSIVDTYEKILFRPIKHRKSRPSGPLVAAEQDRTGPRETMDTDASAGSGRAAQNRKGSQSETRDGSRHSSRHDCKSGCGQGNLGGAGSGSRLGWCVPCVRGWYYYH